MKVKYSDDGLREAVFSDCERYRYSLRVLFDNSGFPMIGSRYWVAFLMLNPSTADELKNDPTVERCCRRAKALGYHGVEVINLFALRSTDPKALLTFDDPVGPDNDSIIRGIVASCDIVICAWGASKIAADRAKLLLPTLRGLNPNLYALKLTKNGHPQHPLYVPYAVNLVDYNQGGCDD